MSNHSRRKGAGFEREVATDLSRILGVEVKRVLGQARDGGSDFRVGALVIEAKRTKARPALMYRWLRQVEAALRGPDDVPVIVLRADKQPTLLTIRLADVRAFARALPLVEDAT